MKLDVFYVLLFKEMIFLHFKHLILIQHISKALKSAYNNGVEVLPIIIEWTKEGEAYFIDKEIIFYID